MHSLVINLVIAFFEYFKQDPITLVFGPVCLYLQEQTLWLDDGCQMIAEAISILESHDGDQIIVKVIGDEIIAVGQEVFSPLVRAFITFILLLLVDFFVVVISHAPDDFFDGDVAPYQGVLCGLRSLDPLVENT